MAQALKRGIAALRMQSHTTLPALPEWLYELDFARACVNADPWAVGDLVQQLRAVEHRLRLRAAARNASCLRWKLNDPPPETPALPEWAADDENAQKHMVVALGRLAFGSAIEAAFVQSALDHGAPGAPEADSSGPRIYNDAYLVAVWTSAHAEYVSCVQSGVEEPPVPGPLTVPNAAGEFDLSDIFSRRFCPRVCSKSTLPLLQMLMRCTTPGSRGWNSMLDLALKESMATRIVVGNAVVVALGGMHPFLHPALRAPWNLRMRATRVAQHRLTDLEVRAALVGTATATKEATRRLLASTMQAVPAMHAAFVHVGHPVGVMRSPPMDMPHRGMEAAMAAFVDAGLAMCSPHADVSYAAAISAGFRGGEGGASAHVDMGWDSSWLGKGTASVSQKVPLVSVAADLWSAAFRTNFVVFWTHCMSQQMRAHRLDASQHSAIHGLNACTKLVSELSPAQQLQAQRVALQHPSAGLLTIREAADALRIDGVAGSSSNGGAKNSQEALQAISAAGAEPTARLLAFARAAWLCEELLVVNLSPETRRMQLRALYMRLGRTDYNERTACVDALPVHATHLHACAECKRVANACVANESKQSSAFTELGVSSCMLCTECVGADVGQTNIRCAKRSSAALRSAVAQDETMTLASEELETASGDAQAARRLLGEMHVRQTSGTAAGEALDTTGVVARVRRDAKNALEQRSPVLGCGEQPMLCVEIVGRAIRIWNDWFALCSFCGAMLRVLPQNRHGAEICCLRCDAQMLGVLSPVPTERRSLVCRYCAAEDTQRSTSHWKVVKAPLDVSGDNAALPPPLRSCAYCPAHWRSWLASAHKVLPTRVILSHVAHNAKPIFSMEKTGNAEDLGFRLSHKGRKRQRGARTEALNESHNE